MDFKSRHPELSSFISAFVVVAGTAVFFYALPLAFSLTDPPKPLEIQAAEHFEYDFEKITALKGLKAGEYYVTKPGTIYKFVSRETKPYEPHDVLIWAKSSPNQDVLYPDEINDCARDLKRVVYKGDLDYEKIAVAFAQGKPYIYN